MTESIKVDGRALRAAQKCQATDDIRWFLNGICLQTDGRIEATNGHVAIQMKDQFELTEQKLIKFYEQFPENIRDVELQFLTDGYGVAICEVEHLEIDEEAEENYVDWTERRAVAFEMVTPEAEGKFPNISNIIPSGESLPIKKFSFHSNYLAIIKDVFGAVGVDMELHRVTEEGPMLVSPSNHSNYITGDVVGKASLVIMPMRMYEPNEAINP